MEFQSVNKIFEKSIKDNWWKPALSNYQGDTMTYAMMAEHIEMLQITFRNCKLAVGEKVAICGRNQANWAVCFMAALTYGAVPVLLLHEFNPADISSLVAHSEARLFFVDEQIWSQLDPEQMPALGAVVCISTLDFLMSRHIAYGRIREDVIEMFHKMHPHGMHPDEVNYYEDKPDELALINYTSGTSGFSKGVMIPYRSLYLNYHFAKVQAEPQMSNKSHVVSMLPLAHMYGLMFEFFYEICIGAHIYFLNRVPSPNIIMGAFKQLHPDIVVCVPLIIEKVYKSKIRPTLDRIGFFLHIPFVGPFVRRKIRKQLVDAFGGKNLEEVIVGGAAINPQVESFFHSIRFPFTLGYGMTECGPIITYSKWHLAKVGSCGKPVHGCRIRIDSRDPKKIPGEVQIKGDNVFLGYFKNPEATAATFTKDGWFKTGDMGVIRNGHLYLKGRSKCMILSANGQNIYPEELEAIINNVTYVVESLVVSDDSILTAIIYPDYKQAELDGLSRKELMDKFTADFPEINKKLPNYAHIGRIVLLEEDFERTPKRNIKRYLYQPK